MINLIKSLLDARINSSPILNKNSISQSLENDNRQELESLVNFTIDSMGNKKFITKNSIKN